MAFLKGRLFLDQPAFFEVVSFPKEAAPSRKVVLSGETVVLQQRFHDKEQDEYSGGRKDEQEYFFYVYENNVFIGVRFVFGQRLYGRIEVIGGSGIRGNIHGYISYIDTVISIINFCNLIFILHIIGYAGDSILEDSRFGKDEIAAFI